MRVGINLLRLVCGHAALNNIKIWHVGGQLHTYFLIVDISF